MKQRKLMTLSLSGLLFSGCAMVGFDKFTAEGSTASAFCTTGGPGGTLGIGPGGIVTGAKVNEGFVGTIIVQRDCSLSLESEKP